MGIVDQLDRRLIEQAKRLPHSWRPGFVLATYVGEPVVMGLLTGALAAIMWQASGLAPAERFAVATMSAILSENLIKLILRRQRPDTYVPLLHHSYSFPSGHAYGTALVLGLASWMAWHNLGTLGGLSASLVAVCGVVSVGTSRIVLGAHYPSDVIGGWVLAMCTIPVIILITRLG